MLTAIENRAGTKAGQIAASDGMPPQDFTKELQDVRDSVVWIYGGEKSSSTRRDSKCQGPGAEAVQKARPRVVAEARKMVMGGWVCRAAGETNVGRP